MGHSATWNDNPLIFYDELIFGIRDCIIPYNFELISYERNEEREVVEVVYKEFWFMVDNDYLSW